MIGYSSSWFIIARSAYLYCSFKLSATREKGALLQFTHPNSSQLTYELSQEITPALLREDMIKVMIIANVFITDCFLEYAH